MEDDEWKVIWYWSPKDVGFQTIDFNTCVNNNLYCFYFFGNVRVFDRCALNKRNKPDGWDFYHGRSCAICKQHTISLVKDPFTLPLSTNVHATSPVKCFKIRCTLHKLASVKVAEASSIKTLTSNCIRDFRSHVTLTLVSKNAKIHWDPQQHYLPQLLTHQNKTQSLQTANMVYLAKGWLSTVYSWWSGSFATNTSALDGHNVNNPGIELMVKDGINACSSSNAISSTDPLWTSLPPTILFLLYFTFQFSKWEKINWHKQAWWLPTLVFTVSSTRTGK